MIRRIFFIFFVLLLRDETWQHWGNRAPVFIHKTSAAAAASCLWKPLLVCHAWPGRDLLQGQEEFTTGEKSLLPCTSGGCALGQLTENKTVDKQESNWDQQLIPYVVPSHCCSAMLNHYRPGLDLNQWPWDEGLPMPVPFASWSLLVIYCLKPTLWSSGISRPTSHWSPWDLPLRISRVEFGPMFLNWLLSLHYFLKALPREARWFAFVLQRR